MQGEVELRSGAARLKPSFIWVKAVGIEDGNCEKVTTRMKPSVIVWDLETVPDPGGFAAANAFRAWAMAEGLLAEES